MFGKAKGEACGKPSVSIMINIATFIGFLSQALVSDCILYVHELWWTGSLVV